MRDSHEAVGSSEGDSENVGDSDNDSESVGSLEADGVGMLREKDITAESDAVRNVRVCVDVFVGQHFTAVARGMVASNSSTATTDMVATLRIEIGGAKLKAALYGRPIHTIVASRT